MSFDAQFPPIGLQTKENVAPRGKFRLVENGFKPVPNNDSELRGCNSMRSTHFLADMIPHFDSPREDK